MARVLIDLLGAVASLSTLVGFSVRHLQKQRRRAELSHQEYVRQLRRENDEIDAERQRIERGGR